MNSTRFICRTLNHKNVSMYMNKVPVTSSVRTFYNTRYINEEAPTENTKVDDKKVNDVLEKILELNVLEMNQFVHAFKSKMGFPKHIGDPRLFAFGAATQGGVAAGGAGAAAGGAAPAAEAPKVKESFNIKLGAVDQKAKIKIIKEVRTITGLGLKEAKELVEKAPVVVKEGVKKEEAEAFKKLLVDAGAVCELE